MRPSTRNDIYYTKVIDSLSTPNVDIPLRLRIRGTLKIERSGLYGTINKEISEYSARHGDLPLSNGSFTSNAYYIYDIIDGKPTNVRRYEINDQNREIIQRFDKQYKSEVYKGAEYASHVLSEFWRENVGLFGNASRAGNRKTTVPNAVVDVKAGLGTKTLPGTEGNNGGLWKGAATGTGRSRCFLYSNDGRVVGWYDGKTKEVHTLPGASAGTVAHELGWHATYDHAQERAASGDRTLLDKLYARGSVTSSELLEILLLAQAPKSAASVYLAYQHHAVK